MILTTGGECMAQLLYLLREYGLFIGIVLGTIILIWVTYAIYNAIVRAKLNSVQTTKVVTTPKDIEVPSLMKVEETPIINVEIKSPSLEGEGVIKTGPRKMSLSDDSDESRVTEQPKAEIKTVAPEPKIVETAIKSTEIVQPLPQATPVESTVKPALKSTEKPMEEAMVPAEEKLEKKPVNKPIEHEQRRIILPKDDDEVVKEKPKPKTTPKVEKKQEEKKVEPSKPYEEQKGIIVQKPKPKKKVPPKFHVLYRATDNSWYVKVEGNDAVIATLETQREAISFATIKALKSDSVVIVHRKDGKIRKQATMKDVTDSEEEE